MTAAAPSVGATTRLAAYDLTRRLGYRRILRGVTMSVAASEVLAVIGPNGAGKTTLLRVLAGLLRPSSGRIVREGRVGLVAHSSMLYDSLTAVENLAFSARLEGLHAPDRIEALLERLGLGPWRHHRVSTYSRGMVQRAAIARALLHKPDVLLLDEPLSSLDEPGVDIVLDLLREWRRAGNAMVLVTHQFERVATLTTHVGFLIGGTLGGAAAVGDRSPQSISAEYRRRLDG